MFEISTCWRRNGESDSEEEEFLGFDVERESQRSNVESESDITALSVNTDDLSDFSVTRSESGEEANEQWNSIPDPVVVNPSVANTGIVRDVSRFSVLYYFRSGKRNFHQIAEETNRYARQTMESNPDRSWYETDAEEICAYFALNIFFGIKQLPDIYSYLHLNDKRKKLPRGHADHDKLFKVRPLLDSVVNAIKSEYAPTKNAAIDEPMIPFKGRLSVKQYMPLKPVKRGIKVWECADASNGFVCDIDVYTGIQCDGNPEQGLRYRVVHNLTRTLVGKNHHVYFIQAKTSMELSRDFLILKTLPLPISIFSILNYSLLNFLQTGNVKMKNGNKKENGKWGCW